MNIGWARGLQIAAACVLIAAYAGLAHFTNTAGHEQAWGAILALMPVTALFIVVLWKSIHPAVALLLTVALGVILWVFWPVLKPHHSAFLFIQATTLYGLLGATFGRTLLPGRISLCTRLADRVHGPLSPREVWYTRRVTATWTAFFISVTAASVLLFVSAPLRVWSIFINFAVLPLVIALFLLETLVIRRRVLPQVKGSALLDTLRVYLATPR